ncbi:MAG: hypothetical protein M0Z30_12165 [Actinomycetota bacterium]|nr:hypothetical protein [Actinomycetota bacterium]
MKALSTAVPILEPFEALRIDDPDLPADLSEQLWHVIRSLGVVENEAKLVAGTKTLHHLLPGLVVPMDRAWTGFRFFDLQDSEWQQDANQRRIFPWMYGHFMHIAQQVQPEQYGTGERWRTSRSKILDNALIGFCMRGGGQTASATRP